MGLGFESQADHDDLYIRHNVRFLRTIRFRIVRFFCIPLPFLLPPDRNSRWEGCTSHVGLCAVMSEKCVSSKVLIFVVTLRIKQRTMKLTVEQRSEIKWCNLPYWDMDVWGKKISILRAGRRTSLRRGLDLCAQGKKFSWAQK